MRERLTQFRWLIPLTGALLATSAFVSKAVSQPPAVVNRGIGRLQQLAYFEG
jgi:hypothetical protein